MTYSAIVLMGGLSLLTGLAIYKPAQLHWLTAALGGYEWARWEHFWLTMGYVGIFRNPHCAGGSRGMGEFPGHGMRL